MRLVSVRLYSGLPLLTALRYVARRHSLPSSIIHMFHFNTPTPLHSTSSSVRFASESSTSVISYILLVVVVLRYSVFSYDR